MPSPRPTAISPPPLLVLPLMFFFSTKARKPTQPMYVQGSFILELFVAHTPFVVYIRLLFFVDIAKCGCESVTFSLICIIFPRGFTPVAT